MQDKFILVEPSKLQELIAGLDLDNPKQKEYIEARWLNYVLWWDSRARLAKNRYFSLRGAVVVSGAALPVLVGLREVAQLQEVAWLFGIASVIVSFVIAVCAGLESLCSYGDIWREKRAAAELIKSEGFSFFQLTGEYAQFKTQQEAYPLFARNVEELIRREIHDYIIAVNPKPGSTNNSAEEVSVKPKLSDTQE
ncbi:MAG: DUF4231 domain-containing protein [Methyloglobulus sp.]|nr:DUF4231 domain-containing protein [Methyloglobulus sp.]